VEPSFCSEPVEGAVALIEGAVAIPTMDANAAVAAAVELAAPCSLHNLQAVAPHDPRAVVEMAAPQASEGFATAVPVLREEARGEAAPCPLSEKVQNYAAVSDLPDLQEVGR
jgi:hypothetical protein